MAKPKESGSKLAEAEKAFDTQRDLQQQIADAVDASEQRGVAEERVRIILGWYWWVVGVPLAVAGFMVLSLEPWPWDWVGGGALLLLAALAEAYYLTAPTRHRRFRAALPFRVEGFVETIELSDFVAVPVVEIDFVGAGPSAEELETALPGAEGRSAKGASARLVGGPFHPETTNRVISRWLTDLLRAQLPALHARHPIAGVRIRAHRRTEFYRPLSD